MLVGTGLMICPNCALVVPVAPGFCVLCSTIFPEVILRGEIEASAIVEPKIEFAELELMEAT